MSIKTKLRGEWRDDGHRIEPFIAYTTVRLRIVCPGEGCTLDHFACANCEGSGCETCNETGKELSPPPKDFCWLRDMAPESEYDFIEAFHAGGYGVRDGLPLTGDLRIVYKVAYDEWEWVLRREWEEDQHG